MTSLSPVITLAAERQRAQMAAQGYFAESFARQSINNTTLPTTSVVYYMALGLAVGDVITNVNLLCNVGGSGFSGINMKVGIYTKAFAKVAESGDVSGLFASSGAKVCPLTSTYTVPTTDGYYVALIAIATTTPSISRGDKQTASGAFTGAQGAYGFQNGQTDLPSSGSLTFNNNGAAFWVGVS